MSVPKASEIRNLTEKSIDPDKLLESTQKTFQVAEPMRMPALPHPRRLDPMDHFERLYYQNRFGQFKDLEEYESFKGPDINQKREDT